MNDSSVLFRCAYPERQLLSATSVCSFVSHVGTNSRRWNGIVLRTMIIPDRDPREVLVARNEVNIGPVCAEAFPIVVETIYHTLGY